MIAKPQARRLVRQRLAALGSDERRAASAQLGETLLRHPKAGQGLVLAYAPMPHEPDLSAALSSLAQRGQLLLPRIKEERLEVCPVADLAELHRGPWGIAEPVSAALKTLEGIALVVVPALAFSPSGQRLGQGRGFYDRLLADPALKAWKLGLAFHCQRLDSWAVEAHDQAVDEVIWA